MDRSELLTQSSLLTTKEKNEERELACGRIEGAGISSVFLFYIIEVNFPIPGSGVIKKIVRTLEDDASLYEEQLAGSFEKILQDINKALARLADAGENSWLGNLNALIGMVDGNEIHLSQAGNVIGYIFRKDKVAALTEKPEPCAPHPLKSFSDITSGKVTVGDQIFFANSEMFSYISLDRIRSLVKVDDIYAENLELAKYLRKQHAYGISSVFINVADREHAAFSDIPDIINYDEIDDRFSTNLKKNLTPVYEKTKANGSVVYNQAKKHAIILAKKWQENLSPEAKKAFAKFKFHLQKTFIKTKVKLQPQFEKLRERQEFKNLKIRTTSYTSFGNNKYLRRFFENLWSLLGNFKMLLKKENRKYLYFSLIVIALIIGYNQIAANNKEQSAKTEQIRTINAYDQALAAYQVAKSDLALGKTSSTDSLYAALALADKAKNAPENKDKAEILGREIKADIDETIKAVRFYDVVGATLGENVAKIALAGSEIFGTNADGKIYMMDTRDKESSLVGALSKDQGGISSMIFSGSQDKIYWDTNRANVGTFTPDSNTLSSLSISETPSTWEIGNIATYATNIYILDPVAGAVMKHTLRDSGYSAGSSYADTKKVTLKNAVDLSVDGNIYVLLGDGNVAKFTKGSYDTDFTLKNMPKPDDKILTPAKIYTDDSTNNIFILDKKANRILKFDKSGDFVNQYYFDGVAIDDFVVNTKLQKIWALSGSKIYEGNL